MQLKSFAIMHCKTEELIPDAPMLLHTLGFVEMI